MIFCHPCLYANQAMIEVAKHNIEHHAQARQTSDRLKTEADKIVTIELPKLETAWWQEAKKKPWQQIYPEINLHTGSAVTPAAQKAFEAALVYSLGGGDEYADRAKKVLLHYTPYTFEFEHPDVGLNYAGWGIRLLWAYDLLYDRFTPEERRLMDAFFERMLKAVVRNDEWWIEHNPGGNFNNHFAWHKLMMAAYGIFYGEQEWVTRAIESDQGIRELIEHGFLDEGLWFESSLNYHFTALHGLNLAAHMLRTSGNSFDLYTHRFANGRTLEQGFSAMIEEAFPDTTIPPIGDCYGRLLRLADSEAYEYAWLAYRKPLYSWLLSHREKPFGPVSLFWEDQPGPADAPAVQSRVFPEHGHIILRSVEGKDYWNSSSWAAFLSFDLNSVHSHADKMDLIVFGRGRLLAHDPEALATVPHAFSSSVQRELNRSTICHNTLMVDGKEHPAIREKLSLVEFKRLPDVKTATIADLTGLVYPGVRLQRTVSVTDGYVLDVFQAASDEEHTYEWLFHTLDDEGKTRCGAVQWVQANLPGGAPWNWLTNARSAKVDDTWQAEWHQGDVRFRLTMLGVPGTEITLCDFPRTDKFEQPAYPMLMVRRRAKSAIFVSVYQADKGDVPPIAVSCADAPHGKLRIAVESGKVAIEHLVPRLR